MIKTPFLWFSQVVNGKPEPNKWFSLDGIMVNAYEITRTPTVNKFIRENGIHSYLNFDGPVMMDSGGFQLMKNRDLEIEPMEIVQLYHESNPEYGVVLDYPLGPNLSDEEKKKRCKKTLKNTEIMISKQINDQTMIVPAIHGYETKEIEWFLDQLEQIREFPYVGIGSLVPSVFNTKGVGGITNVIQILNHVRKKMPEVKIHVFGIGSTLTMHLMFFSGADSIDSSGWRIKAAYGAIQLPGVGDRYITKRVRNKKYRDLSKNEITLVDECRCPICRNEGLDKLRTNFRARAMHNAWVYQREVEKARKLISKNGYEMYVEEVLSKTSLSYVLDFAKKLKQ